MVSAFPGLVMTMEHNKLTGLIFVLAASLFGYLVLTLMEVRMLPYGTILFALIVAIACIVFSTLRFSRIEKALQSYNIFMAIVAITIIVEIVLGVSLKYLDILFSMAVFINILLALLFYSRYMAKAKMVAEKERKRRQIELQKRIEEKQKLESKINEVSANAEKFKEESRGYKEKAREQDSVIKRQKATLKQVSEKSVKTDDELKKETAKLERELRTKEAEAEKEAELKRQYSRSLKNIRKKKKEEEELLVVSNDGKSVHVPRCIVVRNIPKESRKLVKDWKTAEKEGFKGCKLCKPHIKAKSITKDNVEYLFIASKSSDKIHKAACMLVKNIESKDRTYFKTYRAALKKGYTACRICNPN